MGKRGPTPESAQIQGLKGNPGKRNAPSAVTAKRPPALPAHLKQYAAQVFEQIASGLPPGMLGEQDSHLIAAFASAAALHKAAYEAINAPGFEHVVTAENGVLKKNPWISILNEQAAAMASLGDRLGVGLKARLGLLPAQDEAPASKFQGLISIRGGRSA